MKYIILDQELDGDLTLATTDLFQSIDAAKKWIMTQAREACETSCECLRRGDGNEWFPTYHIAEIKASLKPIPKFTSKITLQEVK